MDHASSDDKRQAAAKALANYEAARRTTEANQRAERDALDDYNARVAALDP